MPVLVIMSIMFSPDLWVASVMLPRLLGAWSTGMWVRSFLKEPLGSVRTCRTCSLWPSSGTVISTASGLNSTDRTTSVSTNVTSLMVTAALWLASPIWVVVWSMVLLASSKTLLRWKRVWLKVSARCSLVVPLARVSVLPVVWPVWVVLLPQA